MPNKESLQALQNKIVKPFRAVSRRITEAGASPRYVILIAVCILVIFISPVVNALCRPIHSDDSGPVEIKPNTYQLSKSVIADFHPVIVKEFRKTSRLEVFVADEEISIDLSNDAFMGWEVFSKDQTVTYEGSGRYYVDLYGLDENSIVTDSGSQTVTIKIPHPMLDPVEIDPEKFVFTEVTKGFLAFGDLKFTIEEISVLEKEAQKHLKAAVDTDEYQTKADESALEAIKDLLNPVIHSVDSSYTVVVEFAD